MRFARPVRAAEDAADAALLHLRVHGVDELADRHVRIVAVHEVDVDIVGLQPLERLGQLLADDVRIAERACARPCRSARPLRARRGSCASRRKASRYSRRRRRRRCRRDCRPLRRRRRAGSRRTRRCGNPQSRAPPPKLLGKARNRAPADVPVSASSLRPASVQRAPRRLLDLDIRGRPRPATGRARGRCRACRPSVMPGRREFLPAGADRLARGVDLEGIEVAGRVHADRLARRRLRGMTSILPRP